MSTVYIRFPAHGLGAFQRSALLERLIARAATAVRLENWRADAFRALSPGAAAMPPIVAAAGRSPVGGAWVCAATPVHLRAGMSSVRMPIDGVLDLEQSEANALAVEFNRVFGDAGMRLFGGRAAVLWCVFDDMLQVETHDPETVAGHDPYGFQPTGVDGPRLRRLMSEIEMWLFDHEFNRLRVSKARAPITALWLWAGGPANTAMPTVSGWAAGRDPFFSALGAEQRFPREAAAGVVVCAEQPGSEAWVDVERRWLEPAVEQLRSGRLARLDLSAAATRFSVGRGAHLRFWRRPEPWWKSFEANSGEPHGIQ